MIKQSIQFRDTPLCDAFEQQSAQDWLPLEITQLSAGTYQGQVREIQYDNVGVFFEHQNCMVHKRGVMEIPFCTVSFGRSVNGQVRLSEHDSQENSLFFIPSGNEVDVQVGGDVETVYFRFDQTELLERARVVNPRRWQVTPTDALIFDSFNRKPLEAFSHYLYSHSLFQSGETVIGDEQTLCSSIMDKVLLALDASSLNDDKHRDVIARRRAKTQVSQAIAYIDAVLGDGLCPSIVDICMELNISQRNLQYSFKNILGVTPNAYLYHLRLNRARGQLIKPESAHTTVTEIATNWQFWHLGRFANDYLRLFGELPSTTLLRSLNLRI